MLGQFQTIRCSEIRLLILAMVMSGSLAAVTSWALAQSQTLDAANGFPAELVKWAPVAGNPIFAAEGPGHWDVKIRERGWILPDAKGYRLWYTGYDGEREGRKFLGYATSPDGLHWTPSPKNPLVRDHWVEDMTVVKHDSTYFMFAEGEHDNHSEMLTSPDGIDWKWGGELEVRAADGKAAAKKPCGTPTVIIEKDTWYLFYEWLDKGVWLAKTSDPTSRVWANVQDEPVLTTGPGEYDKDMIAADQVFKYRDVYFMIYHGSGSGAAMPRDWNTDIAKSTDLVHWVKYSGNPIVADNKSSGELVPVGNAFRLYTMHNQMDAFEQAGK